MSLGVFLSSLFVSGKSPAAALPRVVRYPVVTRMRRLIGAGVSRLLSVASPPRWETTGPGLQRRAYEGYQGYLKHQRSKLRLMADLAAYEARFAGALRERLAASGQVARGMRVLCLGARLGAEVRVFQELGCFAIGVDLNPGRRNPHVLYGDFHALTFPSESTDLVFTNSFDHVLDADRVIAEVQRVLAPGGLLLLEAVRGRAEGQQPGFYESFFWSKIDDLVALMEGHALRLVARRAFSAPWSGELLCFSASD